jgi:L-ascorbate metabolism protein UlaG (beta-lactamase superfamily)
MGDHALNTLAVPAGAVAIWWFGQSSFALKDGSGTVVQIDPFFPRDRPPERFIHAEPPLDEAELRTDYVLLTHDHSDHTCLESLLRIAAAFPAAQFVGPHESIRKLAGTTIPAERLVTVAAGDTIALGSLQAHAVWAKPPAGIPEEGLPPPDVTHLGYVVVAGEVRIYVSGDLLHSFADHDALIEPIRALRPQLGLLTTHPSEGEFPFFAGSQRMAQRIGLAHAVPAHYACFTKRTYDPHDWASHFVDEGPQPLLIPYRGSISYPIP